MLKPERCEQVYSACGRPRVSELLDPARNDLQQVSGHTRQYATVLICRQSSPTAHCLP